MTIARVFPMHFEVREKAGHEDEIDRTVADHLVGDPHVAAPGISGLGRFHEIRVESTIDQPTTRWRFINLLATNASKAVAPLDSFSVNRPERQQGRRAGRR